MNYRLTKHPEEASCGTTVIGRPHKYSLTMINEELLPQGVMFTLDFVGAGQVGATRRW